MKSWVILLLWITLPIAMAACGATTLGAGQPDVRGQAAAEATAIIQQAEATAMVLQARAMATAMIEKAGAASATPVPAKAEPTAAPVIAPAPAKLQAVNTTPPAAQSAPQAAQNPAPTPVHADQIEVLGVGFATEGKLIMVRFKAPPKIAEQWWQGRVSVIDEATGTVYNEIPVSPLIGPLIGRPKIAGQSGYVMLVNPPPGIQPGSTVTVVLGNFRQEHVTVQ
jgi:hypothetical protein